MTWTWPWVLFFSFLSWGRIIIPHTKKIYSMTFASSWMEEILHLSWMCMFYFYCPLPGGEFCGISWKTALILNHQTLAWNPTFQAKKQFLRFQEEHEIVLPIQVVEGENTELMRLKGASQNATWWNARDMVFGDTKKLSECLMSEFLEHFLKHHVDVCFFFIFFYSCREKTTQGEFWMTNLD